MDDGWSRVTGQTSRLRAVEVGLAATRQSGAATSGLQQQGSRAHSNSRLPTSSVAAVRFPVVPVGPACWEAWKRKLGILRLC